MTFFDMINYPPRESIVPAVFGLGLIEEAGTKAFDQLFDRGVLGLLCGILILAIIIGGFVIRHLYNQGNARILQHEADARARVAQHDAVLERVIVVAEGYKTAVTTMASAVDGMKSVQSSMLQAVSDLAREAEGEARDARHALSQVSQIVSGNLRFLEKILEKIDDRKQNLEDVLQDFLKKIEKRRQAE